MVPIVLSLTFCGNPAPAQQLNNQDIEITCLAQNIYWEARNQSVLGQYAVAYVTINRVNDTRFPNTICEVVQQGPKRKSWKFPFNLVPIKNRCHFSWFCDGLSDEWPDYDVLAINLAYDIAYDVIHQNQFDVTLGATHYHADYVQPDWAETKEKTVEIDDHIFYKWN
jgi:hypothetical protein